MNVLVLFSYGSLETIDDVAAFYNDIFHGHATKEHILAGVNQYETIGMADPLAGNTKRIGRAVTKRLRKATHEKWNVLIANHHSKPSIETVAKKCASMNLKRVVTFGLTPFHSITGNQAYEKKFNKIFRAEDNTTTLIHAPPYCENELFIEVLTDRVKTAQLWLPYTVRSDAEIIFTIHSMPGIAEVHQKMINQYASLAKKLLTH